MAGCNVPGHRTYILSSRLCVGVTGTLFALLCLLPVPGNGYLETPKCPASINFDASTSGIIRWILFGERGFGKGLQMGQVALGPSLVPTTMPPFPQSYQPFASTSALPMCCECVLLHARTLKTFVKTLEETGSL